MSQEKSILEELQAVSEQLENNVEVADNAEEAAECECCCEGVCEDTAAETCDDACECADAEENAAEDAAAEEAAVAEEADDAAEEVETEYEVIDTEKPVRFYQKKSFRIAAGVGAAALILGGAAVGIAVGLKKKKNATVLEKLRQASADIKSASVDQFDRLKNVRLPKNLKLPKTIRLPKDVTIADIRKLIK